MSAGPYEPIPDKTQMRVDRLIGTRLESYELVERLGEGGMSQVYKGRRLDEEVAIKLLRPELVDSETIAHQVFDEARAVSAIGCRGIVNVMGVGKLPDGRYYLVTEFLDGDPLDWHLRNKPRLPLNEAVQIIDEMAAALEAAHAWAIVHGNLKPSNVFLAKQPQGAPVVKLLDFGLARQGRVAGRLSADKQRVQVIGTPDYIAPEQARAEPVTPATDLYALGATAFTILTGRAVFVGATPMEVVSQHLSAPAPKPSTLAPHVPEPLDALVVALLQKDPKARPESAAAVRKKLVELRALLAPATFVAAAPMPMPMPLPPPPPPLVMKPPPARLSRLRWGAAAVGVLVLLALIATVALWPSEPRALPVVEALPPAAPPPEALASVPVEPPAPAPNPGPVEPRPAVKPPPRPASTVRLLNERMSRLEVKLHKRAVATHDSDLEQSGLSRLGKLRARLAGTNDDERRELGHELDLWEQTYLR